VLPRHDHHWSHSGLVSSFLILESVLEELKELSDILTVRLIKVIRNTIILGSQQRYLKTTEQYCSGSLESAASFQSMAAQVYSGLIEEVL
jgi:hypothetical protein